MPRTAAIFALVLMLLTGLVIGSLNTLDAPAPTADTIPVASGATSRAAVAFYDAVDHLLETGDTSSLRRIVHPNFVDHSHLSGEPGSVESLEKYLMSIRESAPDLRFAVSEVLSQSDLIAVNLKQTGSPATTLAGLPVTFPAASSGHELLRIENELVTERWASPALPGSFELVATIDGLLNSGLIREPRLERLTFEPHASLDIHRQGGVVLMVESGSMRLSVLQQSPPGGSIAGETAPVPDGSNEPARVLRPGDIRTIEPGVAYRLWNGGAEPASLLSLTIFQTTAANHYSTGQNTLGQGSGIYRDLLSSGASIRPYHGPFDLHAGHAVAAPGTTIPSHMVGEIELLFVTSGTVEATIHDGFVFSVTESQSLTTYKDTTAVKPNSAISAWHGTELEYRVTGEVPATFWLITISPQD